MSDQEVDLGERMTTVMDDMRELMRSVEADLATMTRALRVLAGVLRRLVEGEETYLSGREAVYYTRAGADPACASPPGRDRLVLAVLQGRAEPEDASLDAGQRARLAVAAMRGWIEHDQRRRDHGHLQEVPAPRLAPIWHRALGSTRVLVAPAWGVAAP